MRKALLAAGLAALMAMPVMAEDVATLAEKIDRVDEVLYGSVQSGSLIGRADQADNVIYGVGNTSASGLDHRIDNLYADVVRNDNDRTPAISNRMNAMEYYLTDEISTDNLTVRMDHLEKAVLGEAKKGALDERMQSLEQAVYGDQHYEMKTVQLPADTVFKVALNDDVGSKTSQVGDPVSFTVQEDVLVGDVLVLPRGTQGSGVVTEVSRPKSFGRSGKVDVSFDQVFSVDDEAIPTVLGPEAKEKLKMEAAAVGASTIGALALGPIGLVGGLFVKGKDAVLPAGSELYIQTAQPVTTKGLVRVGIRGTNFLPKKRFKWEYVIDGCTFPTEFYGMGFANGDIDALKTDFRRNRFIFENFFLVRLRDNLFIGPHILYTWLGAANPELPLKETADAEAGAGNIQLPIVNRQEEDRQEDRPLIHI